MNTSEVIFACIWLSIIGKITYDQMKLYIVYREKIDSTLPLSPMETGLGIPSQLNLLKRYLKISFATYPEHKNIDRLAKRVKLDIIVIAVLLVLVLVYFLISS